MSFIDPTTPNLADFTTFVLNQGVPSGDLPTGSPYLEWAFTYADDVALVPPASMPSILYVIAVYNLGMHHLLMIGQDQTGYTFFSDSRTSFGLMSFSAGVVSSSADQGTSTTLTVGKWMDDLPLQALGLLKTPWGRAYLEYAQMYGPTIVECS